MSTKKTVKNSVEPSRRNIVRSIAIGGGAALALPSKWTKPVLNQVILPSHAQTSTAIVGDFGTTNAVALNFNQSNSEFAKTQYTLLNLLVAPAMATHGTIRGVCGNNGDGDDSGGVNGGSRIYIRINADMSVDLAIDSLTSDDSVSDVCGATSTLTGTNIADTTISVNKGELDDNAPTRDVILSNMIASATEVNGDYATTGTEDDDSGVCSGTFTAVIGNAFPAGVNNACGIN